MGLPAAGYWCQGGLRGLPCAAVLAQGLCCARRGITEGWRGWSVTMKDGTQWAELAGHDYVLDLISDLELLHGFPKQKSYFLIASEGLDQSRGAPWA